MFSGHLVALVQKYWLTPSMEPFFSHWICYSWQMKNLDYIEATDRTIHAHHLDDISHIATRGNLNCYYLYRQNLKYFILVEEATSWRPRLHKSYWWNFTRLPAWRPELVTLLLGEWYRYYTGGRDGSGKNYTDNCFLVFFVWRGE